VSIHAGISRSSCQIFIFSAKYISVSDLTKESENAT